MTKAAIRSAQISRRTLVSGFASIALAAPLSSARAQATAQTHRDIVLKSIPSTGERIPAIGMGSWLTFDVGSDEALRAARTKVLRAFFAAGGTLIDSSPMYGTSQQVIGDAMLDIKEKSLFSADKVWVNGREAGVRQIERSRAHWGVDRFDLVQVHNLVGWRDHLETLFAMKAEGRLRYVGVTSYSGLRYDQIEQIMQTHPVDFIQITYNIADREAENRLLPLAQEKGIAVIANRPFREGALIDFVKRHHLPAMAAEIGATNWSAFLLKFIISHPALTVVIPATRRVDHMNENMGALTGPLPDQPLREDMIKAFSAL